MHESGTHHTKWQKTDCDNGKCQQTVWQEDACKTTDPYCVDIAVCGKDRIKTSNKLNETIK